MTELKSYEKFAQALTKVSINKDDPFFEWEVIHALRAPRHKIFMTPTYVFDHPSGIDEEGSICMCGKPKIQVATMLRHKTIPNKYCVAGCCCINRYLHEISQHNRDIEMSLLTIADASRKLHKIGEIQERIENGDLFCHKCKIQLRNNEPNEYDGHHYHKKCEPEEMKIQRALEDQRRTREQRIQEQRAYENKQRQRTLEEEDEPRQLALEELTAKMLQQKMEKTREEELEVNEIRRKVLALVIEVEQRRAVEILSYGTRKMTGKKYPGKTWDEIVVLDPKFMIWLIKDAPFEYLFKQEMTLYLKYKNVIDS